VIVSAGGAAEEIAGDAAIYIDAEDYTDIAEQMMRIYKDEALRNRLIEDGRAIANDYTLEKSAQVFWQSILSAIH
jgi:glycosyltransferase involved in cell wall biosynthesis